MQKAALVTRKRGDKWVGALVIDNEFQDVFTKDSLSSLADNSILPLLGVLAGEQVTITIEVMKPNG